MPDNDTPAPEAATATVETDTPASVKETDTVDFWKAKAREQEKRAKSNADAADRLAKFEESQKTETQKLAEAKEAAERDAASARTEALRYRIATKFRIGDEDAETFLTGADEETITRQAQRLSTLNQPGTPRPDPSQGSRGSTGAADMNSIIRSGLRGGA